MAVEVGDGGAVDFFRDEDDEFFGELHQVVVVGVGLVELEHGELGVVPGADAFVAEVAVDLVDAVEAADDQALEVELGRDAQEEVEVERVVVRGEGLRGCASGDLVHHRGFDFEVAAMRRRRLRMARRMAARLTKTSRTFGVSGSAGSGCGCFG